MNISTIPNSDVFYGLSGVRGGGGWGEKRVIGDKGVTFIMA